MMFWDSSAIIVLLVKEKSSVRMHSIINNDPMMAVWWATPVECCSAFARLRRDRVLKITDEAAAISLLKKLGNAWIEILPSEEIRDNACLIISRHQLRAADSLQLSAAVSWSGAKPHNHTFVCLDERLREAAAKEGFAVVP
jgi:predicted nucleic acid-binding protein